MRRCCWLGALPTFTSYLKRLLPPLSEVPGALSPFSEVLLTLICLSHLLGWCWCWAGACMRESRVAGGCVG